MKGLHLLREALLTIVLAMCLTIGTPDTVRAGTATGDRVLTGELVVTNAASNQFRLVEHNGAFTAPAGTALHELDGKPVQVELGRDGRVLQISQMRIDIEPIAHGFEVISGQLVLRDAVTRTFAIAGDGRTYVAPQGIDIEQYTGRLVEMRLDEQGRVMNINLIARSGDAPVSRPSQSCTLGDVSIASGASMCRSGTSFRCADGQWVNIGLPCD